MTARMSRQAAGKLTIAMLVVAVGGVMGVGALAIGGEGTLPQPAAPAQPQPTQVETQSEEAEPQRDRAALVEEIVWGVTDFYAWEFEEEQVADTGDDGAVGETPSQGPATSIRYLGSIIGPERRLAIVSIDGKQRILAENTEVSGYRLQRVEDDHIIVRRGAAQPTQIDKAPSDGNMVTMIAGTNDNAGAVGAGATGEEFEDNLSRTERLRQEAMERQRERLGTRGDEYRQEIERRRNGAPNARNGGTTARNPATSPSFRSGGSGDADQEDDH